MRRLHVFERLHEQCFPTTVQPFFSYRTFLKFVSNHTGLEKNTLSDAIAGFKKRKRCLGEEALKSKRELKVKTSAAELI